MACLVRGSMKFTSYNREGNCMITPNILPSIRPHPKRANILHVITFQHLHQSLTWECSKTILPRPNIEPSMDSHAVHKTKVLN